MRGLKRTIFLLSFILISFSLLSRCSNINGNDGISNKQPVEINAINVSLTTEESGDMDIFDTVKTEQPSLFEDSETHSPIKNVIEAEFEFLANNIDSDLIMESLLYIASNSRKDGSIGEQITIEYISEKLLEYGWIPSFHDFTVYKQSPETTTHLNSNHMDYFIKNPYNEILGHGKNVIAVGNSYDEAKKTIYLVAHHDTKNFDIEHIGLINNASGVVTLLEIARLIKDFDSWFNIQFIFTGAEEYFRTGSRVFVSEMSASEKANILGVINVDMVGEKDVGDVVMQTYAGRHNILSLMMDGSIKLIGEGYRSDDLSFHMGEIPVITLANINPNLQIRSDDKYEELKYFDIDQLASTVELIVNYLLEFDVNNYNELLKDGVSHTSNLSEDRIGVVNGFSLMETYDTLVDNGYDSITEYLYENDAGRRFVMKERDLLFMPIDLLDITQCPAIYGADDVWNFGRLWHYSIISKTDNFTEILYLTDRYFGTLSGEISAEEAVAVMEQYYRNEYKKIWHKETPDVRFCVH